MSNLYQLPPDLRQVLKGEMDSGELPLWSGRPLPNRAFKGGFKAWLFFIPWTAFSLFWMAGAAGFHWPDFTGFSGWFPLFGLPFVAIGLAGLASPFWSRIKAAKTIYAVTNRRALTIVTGKSVLVTSCPVEEIGEIERREEPDGSGDLLFRQRGGRMFRGRRIAAWNGFYGVPEVRQAERALRRLMSQSGVDEAE